MKIVSISVLLLCGGFSAFSQFAPMDRGVCGMPSDRAPIIDVQLINDPAPEFSKLSFGNGTALIDLGTWIEAPLVGVCPISNGRVAVFGQGRQGIGIFIIDPVKAVLLDTILSHGGAISPNQRWIVFRKWFHYSSELPTSDECLLYDLSKSPSENRPNKSNREVADVDVGRAIYPVGRDNKALDNLDLPEDRQHFVASDFFWAPDSHAVAFLDQWLKKHSLVLITLDDKGASTALVYALPQWDEAVACDIQSMKESRVELKNIEFGPEQGTERVLTVELKSLIRSCNPKPIILHHEDFHEAEKEVPLIKKPRRKMIFRNAPQ